MPIQRITIKTCDRCGSTIHDDSNNNEFGELIVAYRGHHGGRTAQGDVGGVNIKADAILCHKCIEPFQKLALRIPVLKEA